MSANTSPNMTHRNNGSISTNSARGVSEASGGYSDEQEQANRPNTRGKGKRTASQTNGRRKTDETPVKVPANKKTKSNSGLAMEPEPPSDEEPDLSKEEYNANGKKMTDEEKRKNFLERNRYVDMSVLRRLEDVLTRYQSRCPQMSSAQEAVAGQPSAKG
jgi:ATF/CREB family transcription factor